MFKIFFITFFISELIIAFAVILKIYTLDKRVNNWNKNVLASQNVLKWGLAEFRFSLEKFNCNLLELKNFIRQKRQRYLLSTLKTSIIYGSILLLKGKYKKSVLAYQIIKEAYEGFKEV